MTDIITTGSLVFAENSDVSLRSMIANLVSTSASATGFGFTSNSVGGFFSVSGTGAGFTFNEPFSGTSSFTRTLTGGTISSLTLQSSVFGRYGGNSGYSTTFSNITLPVATAFQPGFLTHLLDGNDTIRMEIADIFDGPTRLINSISVSSGTGDDIVIDNMASSTITTPSTPGNPFNRIDLGAGGDEFQISSNNRSFEITTGDGRDAVIVNVTSGGVPSGRQIVLTDFAAGSDQLRLTGLGAAGARLQNVAGGVNILTGGGQIIAFLQNVTAEQLTIVNGVVAGLLGAGTGTEGDDVINGTNGSDTLNGLGGNDQINAGSGDDSVDGGAGNDLIDGGSGVDVLRGGDGNDIILPGFSGRYPSNTLYDFVDGGAGMDTINYANLPAAYADGTAFPVFINLTDGIARIGAADAPSSARMVSIENATGGTGNDTITGNSGNNVLTGNSGKDILSGLSGNDALFGGTGNDALLGGDGNDILRGDAGADTIDGGAGIDRADYTTSTVGVTVHLTNGTASDGDTLTGIENLYGSILNDILIGTATDNLFYGNSGNDQLFGLAGNDNLNGQNGDDALFGGDGNDSLGGGEGNDGLFGEAGNDGLYGGAGNDFLSGGIGNDVIWGDAGNDQIDAGAGNDFVVLGAGDDIFTLGAGDDRIRFDYGNGIDTIRDFGNGADVLDFTATGMTLAALQANTVETSSGVLMNLGSGSILLEGLHLSQIDWSGDFAFAA